MFLGLYYLLNLSLFEFLFRQRLYWTIFRSMVIIFCVWIGKHDLIIVFNYFCIFGEKNVDYLVFFLHFKRKKLLLNDFVGNSQKLHRSDKAYIGGQNWHRSVFGWKCHVNISVGNAYRRNLSKDPSQIFTHALLWDGFSIKIFFVVGIYT